MALSGSGVLPQEGMVTKTTVKHLYLSEGRDYALHYLHVETVPLGAFHVFLELGGVTDGAHYIPRSANNPSSSLYAGNE